MERNKVCFCGSGRKRKRCHNNFVENSYVENLYKLYYEVESIKDGYRYSDDHPCRKGCNQCCYHIFSVTMLEFEIILSSLRNKGLSYTENIFKIALECNGYLQTYDPKMYEYLDRDFNGTDALHEWTTQINMFNQRSVLPFACPLLDKETGGCSVYEDRPFICRIHGNAHTHKQKLSINSPVCAYIPDAAINANYTPFVEEGYQQRNEDLNIIKMGNQKSLLIKRPIFSWFKVYKEKNEKHGRPMYESLNPAFFQKEMKSVQPIDFK